MISWCLSTKEQNFFFLVNFYLKIQIFLISGKPWILLALEHASLAWWFSLCLIYQHVLTWESCFMQMGQACQCSVSRWRCVLSCCFAAKCSSISRPRCELEKPDRWQFQNSEYMPSPWLQAISANIQYSRTMGAAFWKWWVGKLCSPKTNIWSTCYPCSQPKHLPERWSDLGPAESSHEMTTVEYSSCRDKSYVHLGSFFTWMCWSSNCS